MAYRYPDAETEDARAEYAAAMPPPVEVWQDALRRVKRGRIEIAEAEKRLVMAKQDYEAACKSEVEAFTLMEKERPQSQPPAF